MSSSKGRGAGGNQICRQFQKGACRYGSRCKFSHDPSSAWSRPSRASRPAQVSVTRAYFPDECDGDRSSQLIDHLASALTDHTYLCQVWDTTLQLFARLDEQVNHRTVQTLVIEGLKAITATIQLPQNATPDHVKMVEKFLRSLSHPELVNSVSLSTRVDKMYRAFSGQDGEEGLRFIQGYCDLLSKNFPLVQSLQEGKGIKAIMNDMLVVTSQLFARVPQRRQNDQLAAVFNSVEGLLAVAQKNDEVSEIDYNSFMARISAMRSAAIRGRSDTQNRAMDEKIEAPGGRHDNDFDNISDIEIFPTYSEIMSDKPEYLPSTLLTALNIVEDPLQRYVDTMFRLMRHDIFGPMKTVLKTLLAQASDSRTPTLSNNDARASVYQQASIRSIFVNDRNELEAVVSFQGLPHVLTRSLPDQTDWWKNSSRLEEGSLIAFLSRADGKNRMLFLQVTVKNASQVDHGVKWSRYPSTLVSKNKISSFTVKLVNSSSKDLDHLCDLFQQKAQGFLVDFPGLIPATFHPVLANLQRVQREGDLAFRQWILPSAHGNLKNIPPPAYSRHPEFVFNLDRIAQGEMKLDTKEPIESFSLSELEEKSGLDHGQCRGLVDALTKEYSLIQGPPGTGKSFLGQKIIEVLTAPTTTMNMGPILIVCYTNHALDQFLKHILDSGIIKLVRIGSRSEAPELEDKNILVVSKSTKKTGSETNTLSYTGKALDEAMEKVSSVLSTLDNRSTQPTWADLDEFLLEHHELIHSQLKAGSPRRYDNSKTKDPLVSWLGRRPATSSSRNGSQENLAKLITKAEWDVRALSNQERWELVDSWLSGASVSDNSALHDALKEADGHRAAMNSVREEVRRRTLMNSKIIGMTTTSLAKNIDTLRRVGIRVVICEEAAEVTEAHMLSALMPGVEHFIQIGDHKQLRPQINDYNLSLESSSKTKWQLDRSQFERRAMGEPGLEPVPVAQLSVQRRMRPGISRLIRRVYPSLEDHKSVGGFPNVVGMRQDLFWLDHRHLEDSQFGNGSIRSHSNRWEVSMATALVRHLVRQGAYDSSDIALLTPYTGQLKQLKAALSNEFEIRLNEADQKKMTEEEAWMASLNGRPVEVPEKFVKKPLLQTLRVATVDNFQGEEAKVIVVSLVRSNNSRQVGFLATENRINVLLSRAQHGMYLIGNANTYQNVPMWADVHQQISEAGNVGTELEICCPRHPETSIVCSEPRDFKDKSPDGGCAELCGKPLECGHKCKSKCHSDMMHQNTPCNEPCDRPRHDCGHKCRKLCKDDCGSCEANTGGLKLSCCHVLKNATCNERKSIGDIICQTKVQKRLELCNHLVPTECLGHPDEIKYYERVKCISRCGQKLECGHVCGSMCSDCTIENGWGPMYEHQPCPSCK
ncbi:unnamed protein product [Clonostachys rosea f. rosea IK726]|uniref:Uncharacterized protein n=1 Tax=Clonostachys rosea f. rosea IK726 TaxID=1349383 RepID=A0ACA9U301_BIOOC|nr:unnamed protein product [Clonostachys rosea f. rosea IK726]